MQVISVEKFDRQTLLTKLSKTRLKGYGQPEIYKDAKLTLVEGVSTDDLVPAQRYLLKPNLDCISELRDALLQWEVPIDITSLNGGLWVRTKEDPNSSIPVIPPIVEESIEPDGRRVLLINDGMHRVFVARSLGLPISVVVVRNVPSEFPYYAFALSGAWNDVEVLDELPDNYKKKTYRDPKNYKSLYRDFNGVFDGVQAQRKQSDPSFVFAQASV